MKSFGEPEFGGIVCSVQLNERQLRLIQNALEEWFRLRMGQTSDLAAALAFQHFDYSNHTQEEFKERIRRRDDGEALLKQAMKMFAFDADNHWQKTDQVLVASDMWLVIRNFFWHQLPEGKRKFWTTDADPVYLWGPEPGIKIEKCETNEG